jgi:hypothetical protein
LQFAIDVNNALAATVQDAAPPNWNNLDREHQALVDIVLGLVYVVVGLLLVIQMLLRLAWIDVLLVVSPLAGACWVLPQTQGWAKAWNEHFIGAVFTQFVQVVALKLGGILLVAVVQLEPDVSWLVPDGCGHAVADMAHSEPDASRRGWQHRRPLARALALRLIVRGR